MPPNNPYIDLVKNDNNIICIPEDIYKHKSKWSEYFLNGNPLVLEIGTGMGNFFSTQVGNFPKKNFIGMEIRYKRCFQTAEKSRKSSSSQNFVILKEFAQKISNIFGANELSETYIFFPDPWANKDRQKKHRLMQEEFLKDLYTCTKQGGKVYFKTDHREYFDSSIEIITKQGLWNIIVQEYQYENTAYFDKENITEFEGFYRGGNIDINYLELEKQ